MKSFKFRATETELLDASDISPKDLFLNLQELDFINNYLGGHAITIKGLNYFLKKYNNINSIIDMGCGGGDTLAAVYKWGKRNNLELKLTGIDKLPQAIEFAENKYRNLNINFHCGNFHYFENNRDYDIAINSLVCHHLYGAELSDFININSRISNYGFIINDLQRHPLAYYSIKSLTKLFSKSHMVKNDAPLSVRKGFSRNELQDILNLSLVKNYKITWEWAFRYLIIAENDRSRI